MAEFLTAVLILKACEQPTRRFGRITLQAWRPRESLAHPRQRAKRRDLAPCFLGYPKQRAGDAEGTVYVIGWTDFSLAAHEQKIVHAIRKRTGASIEIEIGTHAYTIDDVAFCPKVPLDPRISRGTAAFRQAWSFFARHFNK